jgi:3-isopropylmalate/(R)-2-methylmalate dehydratase large subunit
MVQPQSLFAKIWNAHAVVRRGTAALLWIDRHWLLEGGTPPHAPPPRRPDLTFATADRPSATADPVAGGPIERMAPNDPRRGIVHIVGPEQGLTLPGLTIACADAHTASHGAFGCLGLTIGSSEAAHVLATQTLWRERPMQMRVTVTGRIGPQVGAKDLILAILARLGPDGAAGHAVEFAGPAIAQLSMPSRMTLCNMAVEAGAWTALIAPDETTFAWLRARPRAPAGRLWRQALLDWHALATDPGTWFDAEVTLPAETVQPMVTWGTTADTALPVGAAVPDPRTLADPAAARRVAAQIAAMDLYPGQPLARIALDRVFIGSCTNGQIEDLRAAAAVLRGRRTAIPGRVVPGSVPVQRQAEREGLAGIFTHAGLTWDEPGCSACAGVGGVAAGERWAATTGHAFPGWQGRGPRTHLMSPAMAAAAALTGRITDPRPVTA